MIKEARMTPGIATSAPPASRAGTAPGPMSAAQVSHYRQEGYVYPFAAMSEAQAAAFRVRLEAFEAKYGPRAAQILRQKSHLAVTFAAELIRLEPVLNAVESIIGPDILCWSSSFFIKNPHDNKFISWHQDVQYWGLEADDIVTAWIALTPSNTGNGCMRVMPRSHLTTLSHKDTRNPDNMLTRGQEIAAEVNEDLAVDLVLEPGQFSLHHERTVHGSKRNEGAERRIGFSVRYLRPTARQVVDSSDSATLVRGVDRHGHFAPEPRPLADMEPANVEFLDQLLKRRANGDYRR
jgi:non-heme Fe2+,alpha-ketoglutarate-dependent halogenase